MRSSPSTGLGSGSLRSVACCLSTAAGSHLGTFYAWVRRPLSSRALWDIVITEILAGYYERDEQGRKRPESLYGSVKMWAHLNQRASPLRCPQPRAAPRIGTAENLGRFRVLTLRSWAGSAAQLGIKLVGMTAPGVATLVTQRALWKVTRNRGSRASRSGSLL